METRRKRRPLGVAKTTAILAIHEENPDMSRTEIARRLGISDSSVSRVLVERYGAKIKSAYYDEAGLWAQVDRAAERSMQEEKRFRARLRDATPTEEDLERLRERRCSWYRSGIGQLVATA